MSYYISYNQKIESLNPVRRIKSVDPVQQTNIVRNSELRFESENSD